MTNDVVGDSPSNGEVEPRRVGTFEILEEIGRGGMGIVYRARDTQLGRVVALKRPKHDSLAQPEFRDRFLHEARAASKIMHPNITTVFEVFEEDQVPWMVMELIDGASLRSMIGDNNDPLSCEDVLKHAEGLTDALRVAHAGGVLHLDINPNNILVGKDGRARLTDFGLARAWFDPEADSSTSKVSTNSHSSSGGVAGTRGYMSPEQALGKDIDPRSDIFSLGVVLYEMCTGRPAFYNPDTGEWLDALLHREPQPISRVNHDVPIEFEEIVRKSLAKRTFQRYQSANEMLLDLRAVRRKIQSDSGYSVPSFDEVRRRRTRWITGVIAAVGVIAAAIIVKAVLGPTHRFPTLSPNHRRLTTGAGWEGQPAVSPDASMIAYSSDAAGSADIWIVPAEGGEPLQLTFEPTSETDPTWFPDKSAIAYVSDVGGAPSIWQIPQLGGSPVKLLDEGAEPAVSPDGFRIAFVRAGSTGLTRVAVAPLDDLARVSVLTGDDDGIWDHMAPVWSPDGRTICYTGFKNLWLVSVDGGKPRRLTNSDAQDRNPVWTPDGRYIIFSSLPEDSLALWCVRISGGAPYRLTPGTGDDDEPSLSRDGRWLAYSVSDKDPDVGILDLNTGMRTLVPGGTDDVAPAMAPDGSAVVFGSDRRGSYDLWIQRLSAGQPSGNPRRLTDHPGSAAVPVFSPDSQWVAYHRVLNGQRDIWIVAAAGGVPQRFTEHPNIDIHPAFSPDGSELAFVSDRDGVDNIWIAPVEDGRRAGDATQLTHGGGSHLFPSWSPDGSRIACSIDEGFSADIWVFGVFSDSEPIRVTNGANADRAQWTAPDELVVSGAWGMERVGLRVISLLDGGTHPFEPVVEMGPVDDPSAGMFSFDASGRLLAYGICEKRGDVWLVETDLASRWRAPWR